VGRADIETPGTLQAGQLKVGGHLVMPLGPAHAPQRLTVIEKIAPSETRTRSITLLAFVPFTRSQD
jgi:protein-L-isoaspartate O-methyltransferase